VRYHLLVSLISKALLKIHTYLDHSYPIDFDISINRYDHQKKGLYNLLRSYK